MKSHCSGTAIIVALLAIRSLTSIAQTLDHTLPEAPRSQTIAAASTQSDVIESDHVSAGSSADGVPTQLTRRDAEKIALANNPNIHVSQLLAKVQHQSVREARADELPNLNGNLTAVQAYNGSRISSGSLTASRLVNHSGAGVVFSQLITDFGHTANLVGAAKLQEKARQSDALASREDIVLATDQVFYQAVEAEVALKLAAQTVATRQALQDQISSLTASKLRSDLDLSFAQVTVSQAKLLQLDAQNKLDSAKAALSAVLGYDKLMNYELVDDSNSLPALSPDADALIAQAFQNRPDLESLRFSEQAANTFRKAQRDQLLPTISALGVVGGTPTGSTQYVTTNWYGAVGGNLSIPIFNGFRLTAQASEASLQAQVASEKTRALRDQVARDVRTAWLDANTALLRVTVTEELVREANTALDLAQTRYRLGLSSIVELSQAELQQTQAAISHADARSQYAIAIAAINFEIGTQP
jgi:outer membrane protein